MGQPGKWLQSKQVLSIFTRDVSILITSLLQRTLN